MKRFIVILLGIVFLNSCYGNSKVMMDAELKENISVDTTLIEEFQLFWTEFRKSVINSDYETLKELVQFPFSVDGFTDNYPQDKIYSGDFIFVFNIFLKENTVSFNNLTNHMEFIKNISDISDYISLNFTKESIYIHTNGITLEMMEFEKINSDWKLTRIYMDTNDLEEKIKEHRKGYNN